MEDTSYQKKLEEQEAAYEALCRRCGECCGAFGEDPCEHLVETGDGRHECDSYADRLGPQKTRSGVIFTCVTMRNVHKHGVFYNNCAYTG
jgi:uncharacterized cysteine cluster protein YcgN (CxxCxxCC family)